MFEIGKIATTHGIKGEVKINSLSDFERFKKNDKVFIMYNNERIDLTVEQSRSHKNVLIVKFKEYNNINEVLDFKGQLVYSETRGKLKKNEFYHETLIGLEVFTDKDEYLGPVNDVVELPHGHLLEITSNEKKLLIPFVKEFIVSISDDKIIIKPIEGLIWLLILLQFFQTFLISF